MNSLTIDWQPSHLADRSFGHGFGIYARAKGQRKRPVAFVEGFAWRRGGNEAVVFFDPQSVPTDQQEFAAFKAAIEARIRSGDVSPGKIVPGYWGGANA